jgi:hypothetical protein
MNITSHHPEYQQMVYGMKTGHLPASAADIASVDGTTTQPSAPPQEKYTPSSGSTQGSHPEYVEYCEYAKSLGYHGAC